MARFRVSGFVSTHLEHREHAIGNRIAAGGIAGAEQHCKETDRLFSHRARIEQSEKPANHHDAAHEVETRHQWGMQDRRHATNDHPAGKCGEHKDVQGDEAGNDYSDRIMISRSGSCYFRGRHGCHLLAFTGMGEDSLGENLVVPADLDDIILPHQDEQVVPVLGVALAGILAKQ